MKALGGVNGSAIGDHFFFGHGNSGGADEIDFCVAPRLLTSWAAPQGTLALKIRAGQERSGQQGMKNDGAKQVSLEREIIRNGKSRSHTVILLCPPTLREWLSHDTYIVDPGNAQRVDDGGKNAERNGFITA